MKTPALLSVALLLVVVVSVVTTTSSQQTNFEVVVKNSVTPSPIKMYSTFVAYRGILLGGLKRLSETANFSFTYTETLDYGPYLESVNGLVGNPEEHTYWELLVKKTNNSIIRPDVGIGCYIPNANEQIILQYSKY